MIQQRYQLTLSFSGPMLSQASGTLGFGFDTAMLRNADGLPVLNGSLIRGNLRETLQLFVETDPSNQKKGIQQFIRSWFGGEQDKNHQQDGFKNERAKICFDYFWELKDKASYDKTNDQQRTRIQIEENGNVKDGALQVIEDCFPLGGKNAVFIGGIDAYFHTPSEQAYFERLINMALNYIPAMGSFKGIGFGKLTEKDSALTPVTAPPIKTVDTLTGDETSIAFSFVPDRPFCLGKPRTPDDNRIVSDDIISGNTLKALLANTLLRMGENLKELAFDDWHLSHFHPESDCYGIVEPVMPLSWAFVETQSGDESLNDMCLTTLEDYHRGTAPSFKPDWKSKQEDAAFWQALELEATDSDNNERPALRPARQLIVRTGINSPSQTAAHSQLFSVDYVLPKTFTWRGSIHLSKIQDTKQRQKALTALRAAITDEGLSGLGKTKARLINTELATQPEAETKKQVQPGQHITLTLQTAARLFPLHWERHEADKTARQLYERYWHKVSGGSLTLVNFFAQQERHGGAYHYHHFQKQTDTTNNTDNTYAPEWLSVAGSVFVLEVAGNEVDGKIANAKLKQWLMYGLPVYENATTETITWKDSPYLPEHGYGEIMMDWQPIGLYSNEQEYSE